MPARAEDTQEPAPASAKAPPPTALVSLINRLASKGMLSKQDADDLNSMAEADAADARVEAAEARLAAAKAEAAAARARAALSRAVAELAATKANQNAAVMLLLGRGKGTPPPAAEPSEPVAALPAPAPVAESAPPPEQAAPETQTQPESQAARVADEAEAATRAPSPAPAAAPAAEAPAPEDTAAPADTGAVASSVSQPPMAPMSAAEAPASLSTTRITRNEEGAVVVPEDADAGQSRATVVPSETDNPSAPESDASSKQDVSKPDDSSASDQGASASKEAPSADTASAATDNTGASTDSGNPPVAARDDSAAPADGSMSSSGSQGPAQTAAEAPVSGSAGVATGDASATPAATDDVVRVPYVPEVVKNQIREEVKNEVVAEARKENWGAPSSGPEWVSKFTLYGDIRIRAEELINHAGNDNTGAFPNFNAINTGAPFDTAGNVFSPQYNVDQNRNRERLRARLGFAVDVSGGFTAGIRIATGNDNNPVTENQTFGASGNAQGGDFSKYSLWLDRAYIKYESLGEQGPPFWMTFGRFDNPFFSTSLIWANDIGFDGFAVSIPVKANVKGQPSAAFKPFLVAGAFPIFNTDLNYATNSPTKFKSYDKWLYAGQLGFDAKIPGDFQLKAAAALYEFKNIQGQLSSPFTPLTSSDAGDTDASRPSFAQNGNTYMQLRDIIPGPLNDNGTIDQFQYYGLATPFKEFAVTEGLYYNHFEPFQISLVSEWVRNLAFDRASVAAVAVNNGGSSNFIGGNTGWMTTLKFGSSVIQQLGDWSASVGYRRLESDAVVDGFNDADFGGDLLGTNLKGFTLAASFGLSRDVWIDAHWYSASAIAGPVYKDDLLQLDLNAKF